MRRALGQAVGAQRNHDARSPESPCATFRRKAAGNWPLGDSVLTRWSGPPGRPPRRAWAHAGFAGLDRVSGAPELRPCPAAGSAREKTAYRLVYDS